MIKINKKIKITTLTTLSILFVLFIVYLVWFFFPVGSDMKNFFDEFNENSKYSGFLNVDMKSVIVIPKGMEDSIVKNNYLLKRFITRSSLNVNSFFRHTEVNNIDGYNIFFSTDIYYFDGLYYIFSDRHVSNRDEYLYLKKYKYETGPTFIYLTNNEKFIKPKINSSSVITQEDLIKAEKYACIGYYY